MTSSDRALVPIFAGGVYAIQAPRVLGEPVRRGEYVDSARTYGYGIRLVKKSGNQRLNTIKYEWELVGRRPTPRARTKGSLTFATLQRMLLRQIEGADIARLEAGEPV